MRVLKEIGLPQRRRTECFFWLGVLQLLPREDHEALFGIGTNLMMRSRAETAIWEESHSYPPLALNLGLHVVDATRELDLITVLTKACMMVCLRKVCVQQVS